MHSSIVLSKDGLGHVSMNRVLFYVAFIEHLLKSLTQGIAVSSAGDHTLCPSVLKFTDNFDISFLSIFIYFIEKNYDIAFHLHNHTVSFRCILFLSTEEKIVLPV